MNNKEYLFESYLREGDWSTKYHYWGEGDNNSFSFLLESQENIDKLFEVIRSKEITLPWKTGDVKTASFEEFILDRLNHNTYRFLSNIEIRKIKKSYGNDSFLEFEKKLLKRFLDKIINSISDKMYRALSIDEISEFDREDLGVCWTWDSSILNNAYLFGEDRRYSVILSAKLDKENVDWLETLILSLMYGDSENELRIINPYKISLIGYKIIDLDEDTVVKKVGEL